MERNEVASAEMRDDLPNPTTSSVDGVTNNLGIMQLTTGSRFIVSNLAAFESYKQADSTSSHKKAGALRRIQIVCRTGACPSNYHWRHLTNNL